MRMMDWKMAVERVLGTGVLDLEVLSGADYSRLTDRDGEDALPEEVVTVVRVTFPDGDVVSGGDLMFDAEGALVEGAEEEYGSRFEGSLEQSGEWMCRVRG